MWSPRRYCGRVRIRLAVITAVAATLGVPAAVIAGSVSAGTDEDPGKVVIYSGRTQNLIEPILTRFAEETGIDVEVRYGNTTDLALLIAESLQARRERWDVSYVVFQGDTMEPLAPVVAALRDT